MAPKARDIDLQKVQTLLTQRYTQRQIALELQVPESTLRHRLKQAGLLRTPPVQHTQGPPEGDISIPEEGRHEGYAGGPWEGISINDLGPPMGDLGIPLDGPPRDTSGIPRNVEGIPEVDHPHHSEGLPEGDLGIPFEGTPEVSIGTPLQGPPEDALGLPRLVYSAQFVEEIRAAWPELQALLAWWRIRSQPEQMPQEKLTRVTYHVAPQWIDAVKREADRSGESYAAVVNRAFALYFSQR
jgi:hypothetical protein